MPIPPWVHFSDAEAEFYNVIADAEKFDKTSIYLTDARRVGIMLRGGRLTLRNHSALTRFIVEAVSNTDFILHASSVGNRGYVRVGDKGAFFAQASREEATRFAFQPTELGLELYLANQRPAVFDDFYDVSIGKWETGLSSIPILIHKDGIDKIWSPQGTKPGQNVPGGGGGGGVP